MSITLPGVIKDVALNEKEQLVITAELEPHSTEYPFETAIKYFSFVSKKAVAFTEKALRDLGWDATQ